MAGDVKRQYRWPRLVGTGGSDAGLVRIVLIGGYLAGKSALMERFVYGTFSTTSRPPGLDMVFLQLPMGGKLDRCLIADCPGSERLVAVGESYLPGAHAVLVVYDPRAKASVVDASRRMADIARINRHVNCALVATCAGEDITRQVRVSAHEELCYCACHARLASPVPESAMLLQVQTSQGESLASDRGLPFYEASAKTGFGVDDVFLAAARTGAIARLQQDAASDQAALAAVTPPTRPADPVAAGAASARTAGAGGCVVM